jgi:3-deoxy-manno-octulosonate cytidylyltransferase (CMP-KDO synthetase)
MNNAIALIPARYASSRLPGKPMIEIAGKPMIQHVYERVSRAERIDRVVVATDDPRIYEFVREIGGDAVMTSSAHVSGTDRIAAAAREVGAADIIVNVQGDEPMIEPEIVDMLVAAIEETDSECSTPVARITSGRELFDTNIVKVVLRKDFSPLYFSRSPIPCIRDVPPELWLDRHPFYRHIGVYAYKWSCLEKFVGSPPSPLETAEQLEQLRMLDLGMSMICVQTDYNGHSVDTPEDVMRVENLLGSSAAAT